MKRLIFSLLAVSSAMTAFGQGIPYILNKGGRGTNAVFRGSNWVDSIVSTNVATTNLSASKIDLIGTGTATLTSTGAVSVVAPSLSSSNIYDKNNLMFYGAAGNGTTIDDSALDAAIAAVSGEIVVPAGSYKLATTHTLKQHQSLRGPTQSGQGQAAVFYYYGGGACLVLTNYSAVENLLLVKSAGSNTVGIHLTSTTVSNAVPGFIDAVRSCTVSGFERGIVLENCWGQSIRDTSFKVCQIGLSVTNQGANSIRVVGGEFTDGTVAGVHVAAGSQLLSSTFDTIFQNNTGTAIWSEGLFRQTEIHAWFENNAEDVKGSGFDGALFLACHFGASLTNFDLSASQNVEVRGSRFYSTSTNYVLTSTVTNLLLSANTYDSGRRIIGGYDNILSQWDQTKQGSAAVSGLPSFGVRTNGESAMHIRDFGGGSGYRVDNNTSPSVYSDLSAFTLKLNANNFVSAAGDLAISDGTGEQLRFWGSERRLLANTGGIIPVVPVNGPFRVIFEGDSLTAWNTCYPNLVPIYDHVFSNYTDVAIGGTGVQHMYDRYTTNVYPYRPSGGTNVLLSVWIGANDTGTDPVTWSGIYSNYMTRARADGFKLVAFTIIPNAQYAPFGGTNDNNRVADNYYIRNCGLWDWLVDIERVFPDMGYSNRWTINDGVHLTPNAQTNIAQMWLNTVKQSPQTIPSSTDTVVTSTNRGFSVWRDDGGVLMRVPGLGVSLGANTVDGAVNIAARSTWGNGYRVEYPGIPSIYSDLSGYTLKVNAHNLLSAAGDFQINAGGAPQVYLSSGGTLTVSNQVAASNFKAATTDCVILKCPSGGSWILRVANDGTLSTVTNSTGL